MQIYHRAGEDAKEDPPLWHVVYHDGDEEDLEEPEARFEIARFSTTE